MLASAGCMYCMWICTERACILRAVINMLGYLFCIFTAPALMVSPEVEAHQRRRAVVLPAGFWRAADGNTLRSDHLEPVWRLLPTQRDGAAIKPQIAQTAWRQKRESEREKVYNRRRHKSLGETFHGHTFTPGKGCKLIYTTFIDTHKQTHWHSCRPTHSHTLMHANTQTAWG